MVVDIKIKGSGRNEDTRIYRRYLALQDERALPVCNESRLQQWRATSCFSNPIGWIFISISDAPNSVTGILKPALI
jgi:hypothetical protein